jgi:hypothetical protein
MAALCIALNVVAWNIIVTPSTASIVGLDNSLSHHGFGKWEHV